MWIAYGAYAFGKLFGHKPPPCIVFIKIFQLDIKHGCLQLVNTAVTALMVKDVFP